MSKKKGKVRTKVNARLKYGSIMDLTGVAKPETFNGERFRASIMAWENERQLIETGKCTRQWSLVEQKELLETGIVKGYQGHHMKSAAKHREYAGDPENIQFLKGNRYRGDNEEHSKVHKINPDASTNGYYDVRTGIMHNFGDNPPWRAVEPLESYFISSYAKINKIGLKTARAVFQNRLKKARQIFEQDLSEKGVHVVSKQLPDHPEIVEMIFERKFAVTKESWKFEQLLVKRGFCTRQWTMDQQKLLLETGCVPGFEPHHMKSSFEYPEYASDVRNIQFLQSSPNNDVFAPCEHLDAHNGDPYSPTNGYYNPETKTTLHFGDGLPSLPPIALNEKYIDTQEYKNLYNMVRKRTRKARPTTPVLIEKNPVKTPKR